MEIIFVRHGQPAWGKDGVPQMDPELTELGVVQAERAAARLAARGADEILSSPARRARQTAAPLAERLGAKIEIVDDLLELQLPDWSHLSLIDVAHKFREAREREPAAWWEGMPGGENFRAFQTRVQRGLFGLLEARGVRRLTEEEAPIFSVERDLGRLVIYGHGGTNSVAMTVLQGLPGVPWEWERFTLSHTGMLRLKAVPLGRGVIFSLRSFNDCEHLEKDQRTV